MLASCAPPMGRLGARPSSTALKGSSASKQSNGPKWLWSPNNINQSVIGIKMSQPIANGWSLIGTIEAGFDPLSGYLSNSQRAQVMNNGKPLALQSAIGDSSRAGQWDNSQFFLGLSNKTYGTLTGGRVNAP